MHLSKRITPLLICFLSSIDGRYGFIISYDSIQNKPHFFNAYIDEYHFNTKSIPSSSKNSTALQAMEVHEKYVGGGTVGDIMSSTNDTTSVLKSGLVTTFPHGTIQSRFGSKLGYIHPMERIALTANGNLQRIFSSYYDAPVEVVVESCNNVKNSVWDRRVHLSIFDQVFCTATSQVEVHSSECIALVQSGKVGIGQLFRHLDRLPTFELLDVGRCSHGGLWREYMLECKEVSCRIHEEFIPNAWDLIDDE